LIARLACSLPNRAPFGLPRLSIPNKTSGEGQLLSCVEWFALANIDYQLGLGGRKSARARG